MKINDLTKKQIMRVSHRLTKIIVGNTKVDYKAQFKLCLDFVRFNSVQEIIRVFILWRKGENYLLRLKENLGVASEMAKTGFYFVASYGDYELYINANRDCIFVKKLFMDYFKLVFLERDNLNCLLGKSDFEFIKYQLTEIDTNFENIALEINKNKDMFLFF